MYLFVLVAASAIIIVKEEGFVVIERTYRYFSPSKLLFSLIQPEILLTLLAHDTPAVKKPNPDADVVFSNRSIEVRYKYRCT